MTEITDINGEKLGQPLSLLRQGIPGALERGVLPASLGCNGINAGNSTDPVRGKKHA